MKIQYSMKKIIIFILSLMSAYLSEAQIDTTNNILRTSSLAATTASFDPKLLPQITPKSPNVASLERYGQYPVSLYTGIPTIEIPIFSFKVGGLTVPISLSYHASGNKVTDNASWVGLGWSLKAGGSISRNVNGIADEKDGGLLGKELGVLALGNFNAFLQNYNYSNISQPYCLDDNKKTFMEGVTNGSIDVERDVFTYNIPSKSNSFVIPFPVAPDGCIWQESERSKITYNTGLNSITDITLTTEDGYKYTFADQEASVTSYGTAGNTSAWLLNKIEGLDPTQSAKFTYVTNAAADNGGLILIDDIVTTESYKTQISGANGAEVGPGGLESTTTSEANALFVSMKLLQEIVFPEGKVRFVTGTRGDGLGQSLDAIEIYSYNISSATYALVKKYKLNYILKTRTGPNGGTVHFLDNVKMFSSDGAELGTYSLQYNPQALPYTKSYSKDYWGYCNNVNPTANCTLLPPMIFSDNVQTSNPVVTNFNVGTSNCGVAANRTPNETAMKAWILTQINYPAGGFSTFDYEAHKYLDGNNVQQMAGGLRVKQIIDNDGNGKTVAKTYKYGIGMSGNGTYRSIQNNFFYKTSQKIKHPKDPLYPSSKEYYFLSTTFSSAFTQPLTSNEGSPVTYPMVTEYEDINGTGSGANGKTEYVFKDNVADELKKIYTSAKQIQISNHWQRGQLLSKTVYGNDGKKKYSQVNSFDLYYTYTTFPYESPRLGYLIAVLEAQTSVSGGNGAGCLIDDNNYTGIINYNWKPGTFKLTKSTEYTYDNSDDIKFLQVINNTTYDPEYFFPTNQYKEFGSGGYVRGKKYYYPHNFNLSTATLTGEMQGIKQLIARNMLSKPLEEVSYYKASVAASTEVITDAMLTTYNANAGTNVWVKPKVISLLRSMDPNFFVVNGAFSPSSVLYNASPASYTSNMPRHSKYETQVTFNSYDADGNLGGYTLINGRTDNFTYQSYTHDAVKLALAINQTQDSGGANHLTTFNYTLPVLGISSMVAPNQLTTTFEYDNFGRLKAIKDNQGYVLKSYQYKYKNGLN